MKMFTKTFAAVLAAAVMICGLAGCLNRFNIGKNNASAEPSQEVYPTTEQTPEPEPETSVQFDVSAYNTTEQPIVTEFLWYYDDVFYTGIPIDGEPILDFDMIVGDWKLMYWTDPRQVAGLDADMVFANVNISGAADDLTMTVKLRSQILASNSMIVESISGNKDTLNVMQGYFKNGQLYAEDSYYIGTGDRLQNFYTYNGKQYAVGINENPSADPIYICMVRP